MIATEGEVRLRCRECLRWHRIIIVRESATVSMTRDVELPEGIPVT